MRKVLAALTSTLHTPSNGRIADFVANWVALVQRFPTFVITLSVTLAVASLGYALTNLDFKTARDDLVHPSADFAQNWQRYADEFGGESDIILVVGGQDQAAIVSALETTAREISSFPNHFGKVCYRIEVDRLRQKGLYQLPLQELKSIESRVAGLAPMMQMGMDRLSLQLLAEVSLAQAMHVDQDHPLDQQAKTAILQTATLLESLRLYLEPGSVFQSPFADASFEGANDRIRKIPQYFFSEDGRFGFLRLIPAETTGSFIRSREPIRILREILARIRPLFPELEFGLTGLPVLETDEMEAAQRGSEYSAVISAIGVLLIFIIAFRAFRHPLYAMATLGVTACWTIGWVTLTVGHLNILSISFIVTLIGLGIDYGILWISRYEVNRSNGLDVKDANIETGRTIGPATLVGALTTAAAFFTTMVTGLAGLRELGWIAGSGIVMCAVSMFTLLPALLSWSSAPVPDRQRSKPSDDRPTLPVVSRWPVFIGTACILLACAAVLGVAKLQFDYNLLHLQPSNLPSVKWEHRLIDQTGTSGWYALSMANSAEEARRLATEFNRLPTVGRVVEIASLIPADQPEKLPLIQAIRYMIADAPDPGQLQVGRPQPEALLGVLSEIGRLTPQANGGDQVVLQRLISSARAAEKGIRILPPGEQLRRLTQFEQLWIEDLARQLYRLKEVSNPEPVTVRDLPESLVSRFYSSTGKWAVQVFAKGSVWDMEPLEAFRQELVSVDPQITGKPISTLCSLKQMTEGFRTSGILAFVIIIVSVWIDVRSWKHTLLAVVPLVTGIGAMFGLMGWLGIALNPANMIALPLILGIGIDYGVHVMHDFRQSNGRYVLRWRLGRALLLNSMTTIISFSSLALAPHWGMISMGIALAIGVATSTVAALLLLPSLLALMSRHRAESAEEGDASMVIELPSTIYLRDVA